MAQTRSDLLPGSACMRGGKRYVYIWADGVYFNPRLDDDRQCMLVIIGADEYGDKDVLGIMDGFRENADSWRDLLRSLEKRGRKIAPDLACGDGALGFWTALRDVLSNDERTALLGSQDGQHHGRDAKANA